MVINTGQRTDIPSFYSEWFANRLKSGYVCVRNPYDPIFISERYTLEYHLHAFEQMAEALDGYTKTVVISFIDMYPKVRMNFPEAKGGCRMTTRCCSA